MLFINVYCCSSENMPLERKSTLSLRLALRTLEGQRCDVHMVAHRT